MRIAYLLPVEFKFAEQTSQQFLSRFHFSTEYARRVAARGHDVTLYCFSQELHETKVCNRGRYVIKALPVDAYFPPLLQSGNAHSFQLVSEVMRDSPDVVHYHNYLLWNYLYNAFLIKANGKPLVAQYHGHPDPIVDVRGHVFWSVYKLADAYLVSAESEASRLNKVFSVARERIHMFPNVGVDPALFRPTCPKASNPQFLYVGRIPREPGNLWEKSPSRLLWILRAIRKHRPDCRLSVVGDGPGTEGFRGLVSRLGLEDCVNILGYRSQEELPDLYSRSWMTFVPMYMDDITMFWDGSLKESLACCTPVAAFNDITPRVCDLGLLIPSSPEAAAQMVLEFLGDGDALIGRAKAGPRLVRELCSWDVLVDRLLRIYDAMLS